MMRAEIEDAVDRMAGAETEAEAIALLRLAETRAEAEALHRAYVEALRAAGRPYPRTRAALTIAEMPSHFDAAEAERLREIYRPQAEDAA